MKIKLMFKNLESTESIQNTIYEKIGAVLEKFDGPEKLQARIRCEMVNGPQKSGPDEYQIKLWIKGKRIGTIQFEESHFNLYQGIANTAEKLMNTLSRVNEKLETRVRRRKSLWRGFDSILSSFTKA